MLFTRPTESQRLALANIRAFAASEIKPLAQQWRQRVLPQAIQLELHQLVAEFGLPGGAIAAAHGGLGLSWTTQALLFEELLKVGAELLATVRTNIVVAHLLLAAPPAVRARYLADVVAGRKIGALMLPQAGAPAEPVVQVRAEGGSQYAYADEVRVENGINSDFVLSAVRTGAGDWWFALFDRDEHGYEVRMRRDGETGAEVLTLRAPLPPGALFGGASFGALLAAARAQEWAHVGMGSVARMQLALDETIAAATTREQFGRPLAAHGLAAARIAELDTLVDAARLMCLRCMALLDAGEPCQTEASLARWFAAEVADDVCRQAPQLLGGDACGPDLQKLAASRALTGVSACS